MSSAWVIAGLTVAVAASAVALVHTKHESRQVFVALQALERERDALDEEWGRLRIEQGTVATHGRVERLARERLDMRLPDSEEIVIIKGSGTAGGTGQ
ncbi:cell division protein FtsL [Arhodomonas sp. SL1]|uniref:cell division protein FtsL n=1 Tax=Arhodomonas sp. SL1 TaxID=3425691 RepID=UPI003F8852E8